MTLAALVMGIGILATGQAAAGGEGDAASLIPRLGASRYGERQEATEAIEKLGRDALPALRAARNSEDPEVRQRVRTLLARIASDRMVQATTVRLDFDDRPLPEVVAELARRTGMGLQLMPEDPAFWRGRRVTLRAEVPVPFWAALDRLTEAAQIRVMPGMGGGADARGMMVFSSGPPWSGGPTSDRGPFRAVVTRVYREQVRTFGPGPGAQFEPALVIGPNGRPVPNPPRAGLAPDADGGRLAEAFAVDLQVVAEPRMAIAQTGPARLTNAVDDLGQSLLPAADGGPAVTLLRSSGSFGAGTPSGLQVQLALKYPEKPGRIIADLEGSVPVLLSARKEDPLVIPLAGAVGKTFESEDAAVTIHAIDPAPNNQPGPLIELTVSPKSPGDTPAAEGMMAPGQPMWAARAPGMGQGPLEIVDAQGRPYRQWIPRSSQVSPEEVRMTLSLQPGDGVGPPAQLRYYGMTRAQAEVAFHFKSVKMF